MMALGHLMNCESNFFTAAGMNYILLFLRTRLPMWNPLSSIKTSTNILEMLLNPITHDIAYEVHFVLGLLQLKYYPINRLFMLRSISSLFLSHTRKRCT